MVMRSGQVCLEVEPRVQLFISKEFRSMYDILEEVFKNGSGFRVALFALAAWCLW